MIINKTKNTIISKDYKTCKTTLSKTIGLMFSFKPKTLLFSWKQEKKRGIHMFFVFFPIDLIWLNRNKKVVQMKQNLTISNNNFKNTSRIYYRTPPRNNKKNKH